MVFARFLKTKSQRGFTLTELAIVLGVIGIILGAIWVAASKVYQNNRVQIAVRDTETIVQGYRSLFTTHPVDTGAGWTDETCLGYNSGFFPTDMSITGTTCTAGAGTYPQHPWGGTVTVYTDGTYQGIVLFFQTLTQSVCNQFAQQLVNAPDIIYENISGVNEYLPPVQNNVPYSSSQINTACQANNNGNYIYVEFKAR